MFPMIIFVTAGATIMKIANIYKLPGKAQAFGFLASCAAANFYSNYRFSPNIFVQIRNLPDKALEKKRQ
jgi:hypothetical protein